MPSPSYRWVCQNCQQANDAGTDRCATCGFPACATGQELAAFKRGIAPERPEMAVESEPAPPRNWLIPLAKLFWWAGGLFIPLSIFLTAKFGTRGYGGPGGWGSGLFILLFGVAVISPTLIVIGLLALLLGDNLKKRRKLLAGLFGLLLCAALALLSGEIHLLLELLKS